MKRTILAIGLCGVLALPIAAIAEHDGEEESHTAVESLPTHVMAGEHGSTIETVGTNHEGGATHLPGVASPVAHGVITCVLGEDVGEGETGEHVRCLQEFLKKEGHLDHSIPSTGYYGPLTKTAVMKWQLQAGLPSTGFFGPMSRVKFAEMKAHEVGMDAKSHTDASMAHDVTDAHESEASAPAMHHEEIRKKIADLLAQIQLLQSELEKLKTSH